jgi:iron complex outermembrane recepter protein
VPLDTLSVSVTRSTTTLARVPASISVITRERIQAGRPGVTLDEALNDIPGLLVNNRYNFALGTRISLRGFGSRAAFGVRGIRMLQDGIPLTMPDGQSNLNNIDRSAASRCCEALRLHCTATRPVA